MAPFQVKLLSWLICASLAIPCPADTLDEPLAGTYDVGGGAMDFVTISAAANSLSANGVAGPTLFRIFGGTYSGPVQLDSIAGAAEASPIIFTRAENTGTVILQSAGGDSSVVIFGGASNVTLEWMEIVAGGSVLRAITIGSGSHNLNILNCTLRGNLAALSDGIRMRGSGCDNNFFGKLTIRRFADGIDLDGLNSVNTGAVIEDCRIDSVRRGIIVSRQDQIHMRFNDILVNGGSVEEADGILVGTTWPQDTVTISENRIHTLVTTGPYAVGVRVRADSAAAVVRIYNNFIFDFQNTGSSQVRAVFASSGQLKLFANNINVNNAAATGTSYTVYLSTSSNSGSSDLRNNILVNRESGSIAYNLFAVSTSVALASDYNIFYGTGPSYRLGRYGSDCVNLAAWRTATGQDNNSFSGDPGYISETDLHLSSGNGLAHLNGTTLPLIIRDIDEETRWIPPDIGADEYNYQAPDGDVALRGFVNVPPSYPELSPVVSTVIVQNRGSQNQSAAILSLLFNDEAVAELPLDLTTAATETVAVSWTTPSAPATGTLMARVTISNDAVPANDTASVLISIVPPPMSGTYRIDLEIGYANFADALSDLVLRGVSGPVTFEVSGIFNENVSLPEISGASESNTITFQYVAPSVAIISSSAGPATVLLDGADHIVFDGIDIIATGSNPVAIQLTGDANDNLLHNGVITGSSLTLTSARGVLVTGGGNDHNMFRNLNVSGAYTAIELSGTSVQSDSANIVENCTIETSRFGIRTSYQNGAILRRNVIHTGYPGSAATCAGVFVSTQRSNEVCYVEANNITGGGGSASCFGIRSDAGAGNIKIRNNFISDWNVSGSGSVTGIAIVSGTAVADFNSVWMNDVSSSGMVAAVVDSSTATCFFRNNIMKVTEADSPSRVLIHAAGPLISDYNSFEGFPSNTQYALVQSSDVIYGSLFVWRTGTGHDLHSLYGDPGFLSGTDLHILSSSTLISGQGLPLGDITHDYDGELRANPPDIGADEFEHMVVTRDAGLMWLEPPDSILSSNTDYTFNVRVWNAGDSSFANVPVRLFFNNSLVHQVLISLAAGDTGDVPLSWTSPDTGLALGRLRSQVFLPGDQIAINDSASAFVTVVGLPMSGTYTVGASGADFVTLEAILTELSYRGISGPVNVIVSSGTYAAPLIVTPIPGAGAQAPVVFEASSSSTILTADSGMAVITFDGADFITFDGFNIQATGDCIGGVLMRGGADFNLVRSCIITGADSLNSSTFGLRIETDQNDGNRFEDLTIHGVYNGIAFQHGPSGSQCAGNTVEGCDIFRARYGIYVDNQLECQITECDILPGSLAPIAGACYGVYIASLGANGSCTVAGNQIHGFADNSGSTTNRAIGVYCSPAAGASTRVYNNFIYDFEDVATLKISAIYLSAGTNTVLFNSILIGDPPAVTETAGIYISSGSDHVLQNNIIVSHENDVASYGIFCSGIGLTGDYNDLYGSNPLFITGRIGGINYSQLSAWQALGYDIHSLAADPGFRSDENLHISSMDSTVSGRGISWALVVTDIDGDPRENLPDIGADEYHAGELDAPDDLTIRRSAGAIILNWTPVAGAILYSVYADVTSDIQLIPQNLQAIVSITTYTDSSPLFLRRFYVVVANSQ